MQSSGRTFPDAGRNLKQVLRSPASWGCAIAVLLVYGMIAAAGGPEALAQLFELFGLSREGFLSGRVWQLVSYALLHGNGWHVGLNALFVLIVGSRIEHMLGAGGLLRAVLAGVVGGAVGHLLTGSGLLVGLSGGCMALLLLLATISPQSRMFPLPVSGRSLGLGILIAEGVLAIIDPAAGVPVASSVGRVLMDRGLGSWFQLGHACHFGGGVAGWMMGRWILRPRVTLERLRRERARREAR